MRNLIRSETVDTTTDFESTMEWPETVFICFYFMTADGIISLQFQRNVLR